MGPKPRNVYLASLSPRRRELMNLLGIDWQLIDPPEINEEEFLLGFEGNVRDLPAALAEAKAASVIPTVSNGIIICADTDVVLGGKALGKPVDERDAFRMLDQLSGEWHEVITGMCLVDRESGRINTDREVTSVKFAPLSKVEIEGYIATGEPMDKAGAYGIQGFAATFIERIEGCYFNVVGLPVHRLYKMLKEFGVESGRIFKDAHT